MEKERLQRKLASDKENHADNVKAKLEERRRQRLQNKDKVRIYKKSEFKNKSLSQDLKLFKFEQPLVKKIENKQKIAVIGAGHAGNLVYDVIFKRNDQTVVCFFDNYKNKDHEINGIKVSGLAT